MSGSLSNSPNDLLPDYSQAGRPWINGVRESRG
jgi:hypothetical protein